jgi:predicted metalloprotease with PDZ domain
VSCQDRSLVYCFLSLFPHGVIEIPVILLSDAFFLRLGLRWVFQKTAGDRKRTFVTDLKHSVAVSALCAVLLCIAALIEAFATPKLIARYEKEHLAGIGVQLAMQERQLTIAHVFPDGPASRAGLASGLRIQRIDGRDTTGGELYRLRDMLHGRVGSKVNLEVTDPAHSTTNTVELVRGLKP